jgi:hypothetical protein
MSEVVFEYKGRQHSGFIVSSTNVEPHYHWFYFNDEHIPGIIKDDCIGFKKKGNQLHPTKIYTSHTDLIEKVKSIVERTINF